MESRLWKSKSNWGGTDVRSRVAPVRDPKLLQIEQEAENPESIRQAAVYMDFNLRRMPHDMGESRDMDYRAWYSDVLGL